MKVIEIFASIDGEGKRTGQLATFIRLAGCNLRCIYCDTKYSFNAQDATEMSIEEIVMKCNELRIHNITLTGGEPLLNTSDAYQLITALCNSGYQVNVETNGSVDLMPFIKLRKENNYDLFFTVDYKCIYSRMYSYMVPTAFACLDVDKDIVKIVVAGAGDIVDALNYLDSFGKQFNIWISPVFGEMDPKDIVKFMLETRRQDLTVQVQLHKIIWDPNKRGV